jgi:hypothetical protein
LLESQTLDVYGFWWEILHPQPIPRSAVPRSKKAISAQRFLPQENESLCSVSFRLWCFGYNQTRQLASRSSRVTACPRAKKKGRSMRSGPVRSFVVKAESEVRRFCLSSVPGDFRMQARATTTSTASRSHSTSDHLLSVVSAAKKLALFARFEKPALFLVHGEVPTWRNRFFSTDANDLWVVRYPHV